MIKSVTLKLRPELVFPLFIGAFLSLYFCYIDEGKYSFAGIFEFTNLVFLGVYVIILFGIQRFIQIGLASIGLMRYKSVLFQSMVSAIFLFALIFIFFIIIS
jgi:hypothetical protein